MCLAFSVLLYNNNSRIANRNKTTAAFVLETWFIKDGMGEKGREEKS